MSLRILDTVFYRLFFVMVALIVGTQSMAVFAIQHIYDVDTFEPMRGMSRGAMWAYALLIQFGPALISSWLGARMSTRPFRSIASGAAGLSRSIEASPIPETGPREARQAARVFNQMQEAIRRQVSERSQFLAAVSHDLRTPLTRMTLRLRAAQDHVLRDRLADDIREMTQLLDSTLAFLRNKEVIEKFCPVDIEALVDAIAQDASEGNERVTISGTALPVVAQPLALKRCLTNLVANAIRYGETAHVRLVDTPERLIIEVADEGPGIPEAQLTRVLDPFVRLEESRSKGTGGTGLGLTIASDVALRHGGGLVLRNGPDGGLVAEVTMPRG